MIMNDKLYSIVKYLCVIAIPAVATAIGALGEVFDLPWTNLVIQVAPIVQTLLGSLFCISSANYYYAQNIGEDCK